jgi:hypothetical protein
MPVRIPAVKIAAMLAVTLADLRRANDADNADTWETNPQLVWAH